jgi:hypothetical protein
MMLTPLFLETDPVRLFAIAVRYQFPEQRLAALKAAITEPFLHKPKILKISELIHVTTTEFQSIVRSFKGRIQTSQIDLESGTPNQNLIGPIQTCSTCGKTESGIPSWWKEFTDSLTSSLGSQPVHLLLSSSSLVDFATKIDAKGGRSSMYPCIRHESELLRAIKSSAFDRLRDHLNSLHTEYIYEDGYVS